MSAWDYIPDYDFEWYRPSRYVYSNPWRTCRFCSKENLHWKETASGWRLMDGKTVHTCSPARNADEELASIDD